MDLPRASLPLTFEYFDFNLSRIYVYFGEVVITYYPTWIGQAELTGTAAVNCPTGAEMAG